MTPPQSNNAVPGRYRRRDPWLAKVGYFKQYSLASLALRAVFALSLLAGAWTHFRILAAHGLLWDYGGVPGFTRVFWTSLTFLDPLAAILLFLKPRVGLALTVGIIVLDVAHNAWFYAHVSLHPSGYLNWMFVSQVAFLLFVLLTIRIAWRGVGVPNHLASAD